MKKQWVAPAPIALVDPERSFRVNKLRDQIKVLEVDLRARQKQDVEAPPWDALASVNGREQPHWSAAEDGPPPVFGSTKPKPKPPAGSMLARTASDWISDTGRSELSGGKVQRSADGQLKHEMASTMREISKLHRFASHGQLGKPFTLDCSQPNQDLFTSESRRHYFWKRPSQRQVMMTKRFCNLRDEKWVFREAMIQQRACLRARAFM